MARTTTARDSNDRPHEFAADLYDSLAELAVAAGIELRTPEPVRA